MKKMVILAYCLVFAGLCLGDVEKASDASGPWRAEWEHLRSRPYPQWFTDAKLGIFIHWGLYSVPAWSGKEQYAEWFLRGLQSGDTARIDFQKKVFGADFTYRDYPEHFKAELFDPDEWASLFRGSGARYVLLVSKHHDGYCLWPSAYAKGWNSVETGPKRNLVGELTQSVRAAGLKMGLYYSLPEWNNPMHRWYTDPHKNIGPYVEKHMIPQFKELISTYKPSVLFADGEWFNSAEQWHSAELIAWYYNLVGPDAIVNNRWGGGSDIGFLTPEYSSGLPASDRPWTEVRGLGRSFGLNRNEKLDAYMTAADLVHFFAKAVAHGGGVTINAGPKADGQIPMLQQERLLQLGRWLEVNGEAIYGSTAWRKQTEEKEVTLERIDPQINFNWVRNSPGKPIREDNFTATWTGFVQPQYSADYTFEVQADDAVRLWVDDKLVIDKWSAAAASAQGNVMTNTDKTEKEGVIALKAGKKVPIRIDYFEDKQNASIRLSWSCDKQKKQIVPTSRLYSTRDKSIGDGLKAIYKSKASWLCYTQNKGNVYAIALNWPGKELVLPIKTTAKPRRVTLLGRKEPLKYSIKSDGIHIDLSNLYHNDLPCDWAWTFKLEGLK